MSSRRTLLTTRAPDSHDQVIYPAGRVHVPAPNQHAQYAQHSGGGGEHQPIYQPQTPAQAEGGGVLVYISPYDIALMRARRRFFGAVFWAFVIYLVVGLVIPVGVILLMVCLIPWLDV